VSRLSIVTLWLLSGIVLPGCRENEDPCADACRRVARCRQEARVGEKILGERDLPPDARCMKRCKDQPEQWQSCESVKKTCAGLRGCYGPLR